MNSIAMTLIAMVVKLLLSARVKKAIELAIESVGISSAEGDAMRKMARLLVMYQLREDGKVYSNWLINWGIESILAKVYLTKELIETQYGEFTQIHANTVEQETLGALADFPEGQKVLDELTKLRIRNLSE